MMLVELGAEKLRYVYISQNMTDTPIPRTPQSYRKVTTLKIMIVTMKTKVLVEFGASFMR